MKWSLLAAILLFAGCAAPTNSPSSASVPAPKVLTPVAPVVMPGAGEQMAPPPMGDEVIALTRPGPDRSPMEAIQGAADNPGGMTGRFVMEVRATAVRDHMLYLDSETDYRDPRCLIVAVPEHTAAALKYQLGDDPATLLMGTKIRVLGLAKKTKIWFTVNGVQTDKYYYQTQIVVLAPEQIQVVAP